MRPREIRKIIDAFKGQARWRGPSFPADALGLEENTILMKAVNDLTISSVRNM